MSGREKGMASNASHQGAGNGLKLVLAWGFVGIPLAWGVWITLLSAAKIL